MPKGPDGMTEISHPRKSPFPRNRAFNPRHLVAPAAAFTMACLLFVYTRTSIRAAKANAQRHRDADSGGEGVNLLKESRRRHGSIQKVEQGGTVTQLAKGAKEQLLGAGKKVKGSHEDVKAPVPTEDEDKLRAAMGRRREDGA